MGQAGVERVENYNVRIIDKSVRPGFARPSSMYLNWQPQRILSPVCLAMRFLYEKSMRRCAHFYLYP